MMNLVLNKMVSIRTLYIIVLIAFIVSHLPFLSADSDPTIATGSRGAWTDEGLNTCQIRNFVNHHHFNLLDCDNFLKTPLFSAFLYPFFKIFGISMIGARLITVLFIAVLLLSFILRLSTAIIGLFFILTTLMLFPIHQYSHLCLAEMYSSMLIVISLLYYSFFKIENKYLHLGVFYTILLLSVLFKIQFLYVLAIPILYSLGNYLYSRSESNKHQLIVSFIYLTLLILGMISIWYLQFENEWKSIAEIHSSHFSINQISLESIWNKLKDNFLTNQFVLFTSIFVISVVLSIKQLFEKLHTKEYQTLLILSLFWFLVELHKLSFIYLPVRYLISFYLSMGFLISIVMGHYWRQLKKVQKSVVLITLFILITFNIYSYSQAYSSRTYVASEMNQYFQKITKEKDIVIGTWAPAFTWETKCLTFPIWTDFLHGRDILEYYHPDFIVFEDGEKESGYAYKNNNIYIDSIGIPLKKTRVAFWDINVFAIKK